MTVEVLAHLYTSEAEITRIFSSSGVSLRLEDLSADDTATFWTEICSEATDILNQYCELFYLPEDMARSHWVRSRARWIGAYLLSMRRGNPALFLQRYEEILGDLEMVAMGSLIIPRLPTREDVTPGLSNLVVDDRFRTQKIRVRPEISTGQSSGRQHLSMYPPVDIL